MKIFLTDKSTDGFFTAVFDAYREKEALITSDSSVQLSLDSELIPVNTDGEKAERVKHGIQKYDSEAIDEILLALKSCDNLKEELAFEYIKKIMYFKSPVRRRMNLPEVIDFNDMIYKVKNEVHKMKGFLRFMESRDGALYAPYSPDNDITELILPHFAKRLASERFVIHDISRKIAGMYDGHECIIGYTGEVEIYLSQYEKAFEQLWKKYYKAVNIESRKHEKQMKGYMPVRYWKFLPEKNGNE